MPDPISDPLAVVTELVLVLCVIDLCDKFIEICLVDFQHVGVERAMSSSRPRVLFRIQESQTKLAVHKTVSTLFALILRA